MPIKKYTTFEEASKDLWVLNPDSDYYKKLKNNFAFWSKLADKRQKSGIQKYSSYKELLSSKDKAY